MSTLKKIISVISLLVFSQVFGQEHSIDSLKIVVNESDDPIERINALYEWDNLIYLSDPKLDQELNLQIAETAEKALQSSNDFTQEEIDFLFENLTNAYNVLGINADDAGDYPLALDYYYKAIWISKRIGDEEKIASVQNNIGLIHEKLEDYSLAMNFYRKSLHGVRKNGNLSGEVNALNNIGSVHLMQNNYDSSLYYYQAALKLAKQEKEEYFYVATLANVGVVHERLEQKDSALYYYFEAKPVLEELGDWDGLSNVYFNIGTIHNERSEFHEAQVQCRKGFEIANQVGAEYRKMINCECLYNAYTGLGKADSALKYLEMSTDILNSLNDIESAKEIAQKEMAYQHKVEQFEDSLAFASRINEQELIAAKKEADGRFKITLLLAGIGLLVLVGFFIFYRLTVTRKQKEEIELQAKITQEQKEIIAEQKEEIEHSINYAQLIQEATLPEKELKEIAKESFLIYLPKDVVSGDFYWIEENDEFQFFCVADCTGHGIPGAFISMIGTILLNEIYNSKKLRTPNKVLDELNRLVQMTLQSHNRQMKDGMDIAFCMYEKESKKLYFSGANNPLWIVSNDQTKLISGEQVDFNLEHEGAYLYDIKPSKQPVGKYVDAHQPFKLDSVQLKSGDHFYIFTDGFPDQFGGKFYKKFKYKPFKKLLTSTSTLSKEAQQEAILNRFYEWKGDFEQIDDVCIMGVKIA